MKRAGTRRPTTRATLTARLDRCALVARHALCVGSVLIFVAAFGGLAPVYVPALSTPALIAFARQLRLDRDEPLFRERRARKRRERRSGAGRHLE